MTGENSFVTLALGVEIGNWDPQPGPRQWMLPEMLVVSPL